VLTEEKVLRREELVDVAAARRPVTDRDAKRGRVYVLRAGRQRRGHVRAVEEPDPACHRSASVLHSRRNSVAHEMPELANSVTHTPPPPAASGAP
jgi:hypothetical protein